MHGRERAFSSGSEMGGGRPGAQPTAWPCGSDPANRGYRSPRSPGHEEPLGAGLGRALVIIHSPLLSSTLLGERWFAGCRKPLPDCIPHFYLLSPESEDGREGESLT